IIAAGIAITVGQQQAQRQLVEHRGVAQLRHLRSGAYPSSCSWCKDTALARKLIVFERTSTSWAASDVLARLATCPDAEVGILAGVLTLDQPAWRRICTERCAKEFFVAEHVVTAEVFVSCTYCSVRTPATLLRCPNCGAMRHDG
ncbi:MAG: hypothetical protein NT062_03790, partial [Proteobacteria bacterium]|nr:hypothetical protein [Pseudomonadota bacterium]